jgi:hypothetical protein
MEKLRRCSQVARESELDESALVDGAAVALGVTRDAVLAAAAPFDAVEPPRAGAAPLNMFTLFIETWHPSLADLPLADLRVCSRFDVANTYYCRRLVECRSYAGACWTI